MLLLPTGVAAQPAAPPVEVTAVGSCPAREAVVAALAPVAGTAARAGGTALPRVADLGDRFEVSAAGQRTQYVDPGRDCAERARTAAVFIALALNPPASDRRAPPAAAPPPPPPVPPAVAVPPPPPAPPQEPSESESSPAPTWMAVGIGGRVDGASLGDGPSPTALVAGAELRAAVGRRWVGGFAAAGILSPASGQFGSVTVRQQRFPFSLGVTAVVGNPRDFRLAVDVGVALALLTLRGQKLASASSEARLDVGGRVAVGLRFPGLGGGRIVAFTDVHAEFYPRPYQLDVDPLGAIGSTSRLWLGASMGAWWEGL
jgi:hypothetical protein